MKYDDWASRWTDGRIGFHQSEVSGHLSEFAATVWGDTPIGRVLVPLCGKSLDMVFLAERSDEVIGIEFVEQAVVEFFDERGLEPDIDRGPPARYVADRYSLYAADFFEVGVAELGTVDAFFDRAALVAIAPDRREEYAEQLASLMTRGGRGLLITFDYDQTVMDGPPFSVSPADVEKLFGDSFEVELLATRDVLDDRFRSDGLTELNESALVLTRR